VYCAIVKQQWLTSCCGPGGGGGCPKGGMWNVLQMYLHHGKLGALVNSQ